MGLQPSFITDGARRRLAPILGVLALGAGCNGGGDPEPPKPSPDYRAHDVQISVPAGWQVADSNLTPRLADPRNVLSVGTFVMRPGGRSLCSQLPSRAYADMRAADAMITIQERMGTGHGYPRRPEPIRLELELAGPGANGCAPGSLRSAWIPFRDAGRRFYASVVIGSRGPVEEAEDVLNSMVASSR